MKKHFILGIIISIFFLYLTFHKVNLNEMIKIITSTNIIYILLMVLLMIPALMVRSIRWKAMSDKYKDVPIIHFFESISVGTMANNLLPFRIGDLAQVFFLSYKSNLSKSTVFSTVILERLCDLFAMGIILICGSFFVLLPKGISEEKTGIFLIAIILGLVFIFKLKNNLIAFIDKILPAGTFKNRIKKIIEGLYSGLDFINKKGGVVKIIFYTLLLWFLGGLMLYLCMLSVDIKLTLLSAMFILSMTGLAAMIPSSPGYLGPLEFFITLGLGVFGIEKNLAVSFAIIYRLMAWVPPTLLGLIILVKNNFSIKQISHLSKE